MDLEKFVKIGTEQIGKPYQFGFKPADSDPNPSHFDCSALVRWLFAQVGVHVPDGSENQREASVPANDDPRLGDVVFLARPEQPTHHVGLIWTDGNVLEAHGSAVWSHEPKFQVVTRSLALWKQQPDFAGVRRFKALQ